MQLRRRVTVRLMGYLLAFLGTWCFAIVNRLVQVRQLTFQCDRPHPLLKREESLDFTSPTVPLSSQHFLVST